MKDQREAERAVELYADTVRRICLLHLKNQYDTEDVFQTVFLKYILYSGSFESDEHEKAWILRVTMNACKDWLRGLARHRTQPLELLREEAALQPPEHKLLAQVLLLPETYRRVVYLFYYEGYSAVEIAHMLHRNQNTVYSWLARARKLLREQLGGELDA